MNMVPEEGTNNRPRAPFKSNKYTRFNCHTLSVVESYYPTFTIKVKVGVTAV
jgi:hypothetical protein